MRIFDITPPRLVLASCLLSGLAACTPVKPDGAAAADTTAASPAGARAGCADKSGGPGGITSKVRHVPREDDPCADTRGVAPVGPP